MVFTAFLETVSLGAIAFFASAVTDPASVLSSQYFHYVDNLFGTHFITSQGSLIVVSGLVMVCFVVIKNGIKAASIYAMTRFSVSAEAFFGKMLINGFLRIPYQWHLRQNSADLINAVQWRVYLGRSFFQPCLTILNDVLMVSIMLATLFLVQPLVSFIMLVVLGGVAFFIYKIIRKRIDKIATVAKDYQLSINRDTTMAIHGIKDVKITLTEENFVNKFTMHANPLSRIAASLAVFGASPVFILESIGFCMLLLAILIMTIKLDVTTAYMTGTMALLAVTAWKTLPAVSQVLNSFTKIRNALPFIDNERAYLDMIQNDRVEKTFERTNKKIVFFKKIEFKNVSFSYEGRETEIIKNFNITIRKGETIGIVGSSGAGKSTFVDLLIGLIEPIQGEILIDDNVLKRDLVNAWLKITGYVPQTPYIYDGTLAQNVAFGIDELNIDKKRVLDCCIMASMGDFLHDLPNGIESFIGERGVRISGGQKQRVAIARALYNKPEVIIFDEATSSLDTKSEKAIQDTIYSFKGKQTLVIIAHRLDTIKECDRIIWIEKGTIKMVGTPNGVLKMYNMSGMP